MINCTFSVTGKYQSNFCQLEMTNQTPSTAHCCIVSIYRSNDWSYIYCYMYMYLKVNFNGIINNKKVSSKKRLSRKFIHMYCKYFSCCKRVGSFRVNYSCIITDELFVLYSVLLKPVSLLQPIGNGQVHEGAERLWKQQKFMMKTKFNITVHYMKDKINELHHKEHGTEFVVHS